MKNYKQLNTIIFMVCLAACCTTYIEPPVALLAGFVFSQLAVHPFKKYNQKATRIFLEGAIVCLGFGMSIHEAAKAGKTGFFFTASTVIITLFTGLLLGWLFSVNKKTAFLISSGTAICGGSAIAAVAPVIEAGESEISVSLGTVFILNAAALFIFPVIGRYYHLSQQQFGIWSAVAIHDTGSVVGAAHRYGAEALQIATTAKLERALWIIPLSLGTALFFKNKKTRIRIPYFILLFIGAMVAGTFLPQFNSVWQVMVFIGKRALTISLFLIGAGLSRSLLRAVGLRPMLLGLLLWVMISVVSLLVIMRLVG